MMQNNGLGSIHITQVLWKIRVLAGLKWKKVETVLTGNTAMSSQLEITFIFEHGSYAIQIESSPV